MCRSSRLQWIDDLNDPRLDIFRNLRAPQGTRSGDYFVAEGRHVIERLLRTDYEVVSLLTSVDCEDWMSQQPLDTNTSLLRVSNQQIRSLVGFDFHRGLLACARRHDQGAASDMPPMAKGQVMLALCDVTDGENVGSIIRSATALGVQDVVLSKASADPYSRRVLRVSMGNVLQQRLWVTNDMTDCLSRMKAKYGYRVVATTLGEGAVDIRSFRWDDEPLVLLLGNEGHGLPAAIEQLATDRVTIPVQPHADSLNVGVAAAIMLYHLQNPHR